MQQMANQGHKIYSSKKLCNMYFSHISPTFRKLLGNSIMFIDKTYIVIIHASLYFSCCYDRGIESMGVTPQFCKFLNFTDFVRVHREKSLDVEDI